MIDGNMFVTSADRKYIMSPLMLINVHKTVTVNITWICKTFTVRAIKVIKPQKLLPTALQNVNVEKFEQVSERRLCPEAKGCITHCVRMYLTM